MKVTMTIRQVYLIELKTKYGMKKGTKMTLFSQLVEVNGSWIFYIQIYNYIVTKRRQNRSKKVLKYEGTLSPR